MTSQGETLRSILAACMNRPGKAQGKTANHQQTQKEKGGFEHGLTFPGCEGTFLSTPFFQAFQIPETQEGKFLS